MSWDSGRPEPVGGAPPIPRRQLLLPPEPANGHAGDAEERGGAPVVPQFVHRADLRSRAGHGSPRLGVPVHCPGDDESRPAGTHRRLSEWCHSADWRAASDCPATAVRPGLRTWPASDRPAPGNQRCTHGRCGQRDRTRRRGGVDDPAGPVIHSPRWPQQWANAPRRAASSSRATAPFGRWPGHSLLCGRGESNSCQRLSSQMPLGALICTSAFRQRLRRAPICIRIPPNAPAAVSRGVSRARSGREGLQRGPTSLAAADRLRPRGHDVSRCGRD